MGSPTQSLLDALTSIVERTLPLRRATFSMQCHAADLSTTELKMTPVGPFVVHDEGISLGVRTIFEDREPFDAMPVIVDEKDYDDPRVLAHIEGWMDALVTTVAKCSDAAFKKNWRWLSVRPSLPIEALDLGATAEEFRERALQFPWLGRYLDELPKKAPAYERAPREIALVGDRVELHRLMGWVGFFTQRTFEDSRWDDAMMRSMPEPVRVLDGVETINAMVGGNGFEVFLSQTRGAIVRHCYVALGNVGAPRLRAVMGQSIALAARQGAEFMYERNTAWFEQFETRATNWSALDGWDEGHTYSLIEQELMPAANEYANRHRAALVGD